MGEYITDELIINEYLNNWFREEDLADYLCISIDDVNKALNNCRVEKTKNKIIKQRCLINLYYKQLDSNEAIEIKHDDRILIEVALYILKTHCSIRECAKRFNKGKTTIFDYIHERLPYVDIILYKDVFDVLMENKSFSTDNKKVIEQVLSTYELLLEGHTINEISEIMGLGWNVVERNLNIRLKQIDQEKYNNAKMILDMNQKGPLKEHEFKPKGK